jgi:ribose transport system ATP-binding protein
MGRAPARPLVSCCIAGEVVGLGGLDGQGQRELLLALFGVLRGTTGSISIDGKRVTIASPSMATRKGHRDGAHPRGSQVRGPHASMSVRDNLAFAAQDALSRWGIVDRSAEHQAVERIVRRLAIRTDGAYVPAPRCPAATSRRSSSANG